MILECLGLSRPRTELGAPTLPGPSRRASHPDSRATQLAGQICLRKDGRELLPRFGFLTLSVS